CSGRAARTLSRQRKNSRMPAYECLRYCGRAALLEPEDEFGHTHLRDDRASRTDCDLQRFGRLKALAENVLFRRDFSDGIHVNGVAAVWQGGAEGDGDVDGPRL